MAAFRARQRNDWGAVLAAVAGSAEATSYLRELAGDARWSLRQLRAAAAEYTAGLAGADEASAARVRGKLANLAVDIDALDRAEAVAARNGGVALACCGVLVGLVIAASSRRASS
jgi:ubiquinone biosynthesis protein UbiJ